MSLTPTLPISSIRQAGMVLSVYEALSASHSGFCSVEDVTSPSAMSEAEWRTKFKIPGVIERPKVQSRQADVTNYSFFFSFDTGARRVFLSPAGCGGAHTNVLLSTKIFHRNRWSKCVVANRAPVGLVTWTRGSVSSSSGCVSEPTNTRPEAGEVPSLLFFLSDYTSSEALNAPNTLWRGIWR